MSSLFPDFTNLFSVGKTISQHSNTDPNDVLNTKNALSQTGDYKVPDFGITDIPDIGMIDGLKKFQQKNGLKDDGVMKPGGPTESKIGETLAGQGVSTVDPLDSKPKPAKIDPMPSLPKVKMPQLKNPSKAMWEQVANQQKPIAKPWFKSTKLQPVSDEVHAENARTMDGMLNYSENGFLPTLYADAVKNGGEKAIAEYANFLNQLSDRKKERVNGFEQEVMNKLSDDQKLVILALAEGKLETDGNKVVYQTSDGQAEPQPTDQEKPEERQAQKKNSAGCEALKPQYQEAKRKYYSLSEKYKKLSGEYFKLGPKQDRLRSQIQSGIAELGLGGAPAMIITWITKGRLPKAIFYILKKVGKEKARSVINDMREYSRNSDRINEIKPKLDPLHKKEQAAFQEFSRLKDTADAKSCEYYGW